jgi:two-component system cell cycle sensor histidine kinase/response regulator CckA
VAGSPRPTPDPELDVPLRAALAACLDAAVAMDGAGLVREWNPPAERLFGWSRDEAIGATLSETILPPEFREMHRIGLARHLETGASRVIGRLLEVEAIDRAGRRFPVELSIGTLGTGADRLFVAQLREISARRDASRKALESERRLALAIEATGAGYWDLALDAWGLADVANSLAGDMVSTMLGEPPGSVPALPPPSLVVIHPDDLPAVGHAWGEHLAGRAARYESEHRRRAADGSWRWVLDRGAVVETFPDGRPRRVAGTVVDITERKRLQQAVLDAQRLDAVGLVASGFAHDLNNLLMAADGHASIAGGAKAIPPTARESIDSVRLALGAARAITQNMVAIGRPGARTAAGGSTRVADAVAEALRVLAPAFPRTMEVGFRDLLGGVATVGVEPVRFQQALMNLVLNARDALGGRGRVEIVAERETGAAGEPLVRVSVRDDGPGIPEANLAHLFEPFFTNKPEGRGTGLGLAVVRSIVTGAGGAVRVESAPGKGTSFILDFPLAAEAAADAVRDAARPARVAVVEDHSLLRPVLVEAIAAAGHAVDAFASGEELVAAMQAGVRPEALVLDVNLPGMDGFATRVAANRVAGRPLPTLFITGNPDVVPPAGSPGRVRLVRKPFDIGSLPSTVAELLA